MNTLVEVTTMVHQSPGFALLKQEATKKIEAHQNALMRLIFRTNADVDPKRVEYDRGFTQGVVYALEALPNEIGIELAKRLADDQGGDSA